MASVVPANGPRGRKASLLGITGTFHPHGLRRGCYQGDELLVPREIPSMDEGISSVKGQGRGTSHQWAGDHSCPLRKKVKKKTEQVLERKTSLQREGNHERKNSSSKYSAESKMLHGEPRICRYCHAPLHPSCEQMWSS